jgi:hypothetical membrane protein
MQLRYLRNGQGQGGWLRLSEASRWLALGGVAGPVAFVVTFTVAGFLRPGYSAVHQAVSDLGVGPNPWLLNATLMVLGLLLGAFAVGFAASPALPFGGAWRWVCGVLLALPGLGFADAGVFTEAPATVELHWMVGFPLLLLGSVAGFFLTGLALRRDPRWRAWGTYSVLAGPLTLVVIAVMFATWPLPPHLGGLMERVLFVEMLAWYVAFGLRLFAAAPTPTTRRRNER